MGGGGYGSLIMIQNYYYDVQNEHSEFVFLEFIIEIHISVISK